MLVCAMLTLALSGCASKLGKPLITLGDTEMSVNIFELYLSRMKGTLCSASYFGAEAKNESFWDTWVDVYDRTTYNTHYTNMVLESAKSYVAALALFEEQKLELPKSYLEKIDADIEELIEGDANGSKTAFNAILGEFGVNIDMLREAYIMDAKVDYLRDHLFGADGSKIGSNIVNDYYTENYARYKQVFLYTYEYQYVIDRNGDVMYYKDNGKISYDTTKTPKTDTNGNYVKDENGDRVYVYTDESGKERIAYDMANGKRQQQLDANGQPVLNHYNDTEKAIVYEDAQKILAEAKEGGLLGFDGISAKYNQESDDEKYPDGYYVTKDMNYATPALLENLFEMQVGEARIVKSDYGYHVIMRYELEALDTVSAKDNYDDIFISQTTGGYVFIDKLKESLLSDYIKPYLAKIVVDTELLASVDIKRTGVNFYY